LGSAVARAWPGRQHRGRREVQAEAVAMGIGSISQRSEPLIRIVKVQRFAASPNSLIDWENGPAAAGPNEKATI
jgi:hypothetical protein